MPLPAVALYPSFAPTNPITRESNTSTYHGIGDKAIDQLGAEVVAHQTLLTGQVYSASAVVTTNGANVSDIAISMLDQAGNVIAAVQNFDLWLSDSTVGAGISGSTASGTVTAKSASGTVLGTYTAKQALRVQTLATGVFTLEITDTAKSLFKVCMEIPGTGKTKVLTTLSSGSYG